MCTTFLGLHIPLRTVEPVRLTSIRIIIHTILLCVAGLNALTFFDHVASADNVSDGGSGGCSILANALGVPLAEKPLPPWPTNTVMAEPTEWLKYLDTCA